MENKCTIAGYKQSQKLNPAGKYSVTLYSLKRNENRDTRENDHGQETVAEYADHTPNGDTLAAHQVEHSVHTTAAKETHTIDVPKVNLSRLHTGERGKGRGVEGDGRGRGSGKGSRKGKGRGRGSGKGSRKGRGRGIRRWEERDGERKRR